MGPFLRFSCRVKQRENCNCREVQQLLQLQPYLSVRQLHFGRRGMAVQEEERGVAERAQQKRGKRSGCSLKSTSIFCHSGITFLVPLRTFMPYSFPRVFYRSLFRIKAPVLYRSLSSLLPIPFSLQLSLMDHPPSYHG